MYILSILSYWLDDRAPYIGLLYNPNVTFFRTSSPIAVPGLLLAPKNKTLQVIFALACLGIFHPAVKRGRGRCKRHVATPALRTDIGFDFQRI